MTERDEFKKKQKKDLKEFLERRGELFLRTIEAYANGLITQHEYEVYMRILEMS